METIFKKGFLLQKKEIIKKPLIVDSKIKSKQTRNSPADPFQQPMLASSLNPNAKEFMPGSSTLAAAASGGKARVDRKPNLPQDEYEDKLLKFYVAFSLTNADDDDDCILRPKRYKNDSLKWVIEGFREHWSAEEGEILFPAMLKRMDHFTDDDDDYHSDYAICKQILHRHKNEKNLSTAFSTAIQYVRDKLERKKMEKLGLPYNNENSLEKKFRDLYDQSMMDMLTLTTLREWRLQQQKDDEKLGKCHEVNDDLDDDFVLSDSDEELDEEEQEVKTMYNKYKLVKSKEGKERSLERGAQVELIRYIYL